jgi:Cys-tRNA(Pro)/Cys-tRNA(Cys) deacylase
MRTRAAAALAAQGVQFDLLEFEAEAHTAAEAAERLGIAPARVFKTLVVRADDGRVLLACVPGDRDLNLRLLARAAGARRVELVDAADLMRLVGYVRGAVSPVATRRPRPTFIDGSALEHERISVSAGVRGLQLWVAPRDLIRATGARLATLTAAPRGPASPAPSGRDPAADRR